MSDADCTTGREPRSVAASFCIIMTATVVLLIETLLEGSQNHIKEIQLAFSHIYFQ